MIDNPLRFYLNGEPLVCTYEMHTCRTTQITEVHLSGPNIAAALRLIPEIDAAPSLDYVLRNWHK